MKGVSQLAMDDIADLRAGGLNPSDADVVRLNALALEITDGRETTACNAPRFALAGGVTFWEPTLAAWEWYERARALADGEDVELWMFAFACANGRDPALLRSLCGKEEIEKALGSFIGRIGATASEVARAVAFACGEAETPGPARTEVEKESAGEPPEASAVIERLLVDAVATIPGLPPSEALAQTPSRLRAMIRAVHAAAGLPASRASRIGYARYLAALSETRERLALAGARPVKVVKGGLPPLRPDVDVLEPARPVQDQADAPAHDAERRNHDEVAEELLQRPEAAAPAVSVVSVVGPTHGEGV